MKPLNKDVMASEKLRGGFYVIKQSQRTDTTQLQDLLQSKRIDKYDDGNRAEHPEIDLCEPIQSTDP